VAVAIIISTHGNAAEQLLKTTEMPLRAQDNVALIDFSPGENAETLIEKYHATISGLDIGEGVLFLVDTWGGSPFNAASRIAQDKANYEVITGVNIPMLVETFMARDDNPSVDELVALALQAIREGVKALKILQVAFGRVTNRYLGDIQSIYCHIVPLLQSCSQFSGVIAFPTTDIQQCRCIGSQQRF